jgi:hypothetical protein
MEGLFPQNQPTRLLAITYTLQNAPILLSMFAALCLFYAVFAVLHWMPMEQIHGDDGQYYMGGVKGYVKTMVTKEFYDEVRSNFIRAISAPSLFFFSLAMVVYWPVRRGRKSP